MKFIPVSILVLLLSLPTVTSADETDTTLLDFKIKDQFDTEHRDEDWQGKVVVLFGYDRKGSEYQEQWLTALRDSLPATADTASIEFVRLGNMRGVPFFLKGLIKGKMPREPNQWLLLDWKGRFDKAYEFTADACNILLFDGQGLLRHRTAVTELQPKTLAELRAVIHFLLAL